MIKQLAEWKTYTLKKINNVPILTGVYLLLDHNLEPIYIGSGTSSGGIRNRLKQHLILCNSNLSSYKLINPLRIFSIGYLPEKEENCLQLEQSIINRATYDGYKLVNDTRFYKNVITAPEKIFEKFTIENIRHNDQIKLIKSQLNEIIKDEINSLENHINCVIADRTINYLNRCLTEKVISR